MNKDPLPRPVIAPQINKHFVLRAHDVFKKFVFSDILLRNSETVVEFYASLYAISFLEEVYQHT